MNTRFMPDDKNSGFSDVAKFFTGRELLSLSIYKFDGKLLSLEIKLHTFNTQNEPLKYCKTGLCF